MAETQDTTPTMNEKNVETDTLKDDNKAAPPPPEYHDHPHPREEPSPRSPQPRPPITAAQLGEQYRAEQYARCAQGFHDPRTKFGLCGIILAVVCFPIGLICMFLDTHDVCHRCGQRL